MYDILRRQIMMKLMDKLDLETVQTVIQTIDRVMTDFDVSKKETALVVYDGGLSETVKMYILCKRVEGVKEASLKNDFYSLQAFTRKIGKPLKEISTNDIRAYLINYQAQTNIKNASLEKIRQRLNCFFEWCVDEEILTKNPMRKIPPVKSEKSDRRALTEEELEVCRNACNTVRDKALLEVFYSTGARVSEISRLNKSDVNWIDGSLKVMGKGSSPYTVWLNAKSKVALRTYLESREDTNPSLFVTARGGRTLTNRGIRKTVEDIGERAGLQTILCPHVLRHTMATTALRHGAPIEVVQRMLNHKSPETTQIYAEMDLSRVASEHQRTVV